VVELSVLHCLSSKRKEQYGTRHFLKESGEESEPNMPGFELFEIFRLIQ